MRWSDADLDATRRDFHHGIRLGLPFLPKTNELLREQSIDPGHRCTGGALELGPFYIRVHVQRDGLGKLGAGAPHPRQRHLLSKRHTELGARRRAGSVSPAERDYGRSNQCRGSASEGCSSVARGRRHRYPRPAPCSEEQRFPPHEEMAPRSNIGLRSSFEAEQQ